MDEQKRYENAKKRVEEIKGFYSHLAVYLLVNAGLFVINLVTSPGDYWFGFPLAAWGVGVVVHGISVFGVGKLWGPDWESRKIRELMDKHQNGL